MTFHKFRGTREFIRVKLKAGTFTVFLNPLLKLVGYVCFVIDQGNIIYQFPLPRGR